MTIAAGLLPSHAIGIPFARIGGAILRSLTLVLVVVALAGPRFPDLRTRIKTEGIAIVMLVNVSGSMAEHDFDWNGEPISRLDVDE